MFLDDDHEAGQAAEITKQTLVDTQARMGVMLDLMPMGLLIHTRQGIIFGNQEAARLLQVPQDEIVGKHFLDFLTTHADEAAQQMEDAFDGLIGAKPTEAELRPATGDVRTIKLIAGALPWEGNPVVQLLLQDITDLMAIQDRLHRLAVTDELTGAFNRRHAFTIGRSLFDNEKALHRGIAVAILDVDHFKLVNDTYGHSAGDAALKTLTQTVNETLAGEPSQDIIFARVGGEEFMILFPVMVPDAVFNVCERIRREIEQRPVLSAAGTFRITASIGVTLQAAADPSFDTAYSNADSALYDAKSAGRNRVCWNNPTQEPLQQATILN
ncbi:sensor domain-containing diguanylate cyclase (plasmid) [Rhizobium sp. 32-5/1]|uniref:sensor domain-containing diguanylate cyclase n=1 Tax=Rhizobium sp. 32-5/1 TaxID=3019602 RepID=UPI00240CF86A|nr:sensor domain-containing diguanylate cyclase [Rhizobium sp. 32-5/1]WEZ85602.1 sensor domain-containing diguanylate cyclase [Rhizobium sp. 32-5/1]